MIANNALWLLAVGLLTIQGAVSRTVPTSNLHRPLSIPRSAPQRAPLAIRADDDDNNEDSGDVCPVLSPDATADVSAFEPADLPPPQLCKRGGCFSAPQAKNPRIRVLGPEGFISFKKLQKIWDDAGRKGEALRRFMDWYIQSGISRQQSLSNGSQDTKFQLNYHKQAAEMPGTRAWSHKSPDLRDFWPQTGYDASFEFDFNTEWQTIAYNSNHNPKNQPVMGLVAHPQNGILVSYRSYSECDGTPAPARAYSSTLTWKAWQEAAGGPENARKLKYQVRLDVRNLETNTIAAIAHELYPQNVNFRDGSKGDEMSETRPAQMGHGHWTPADEAWPCLLAMPNVKPIVNMIADYHLEMDNPYIVAIHTFPPVIEGYGETWGLSGKTELRQGYIVVEFGAESVEGLVDEMDGSESGTLGVEGGGNAGGDAGGWDWVDGVVQTT